MRVLIRAGRRRLLLVSPTGSGKTSIAAAMIHGSVERGLRQMFLAHRRELISQCSARLREHEIAHGIIQADSPYHNAAAATQVASVPTLVRRIGKRRYPADLIIVDEAHRSTSPTHQACMDQYPDAIIVGLTATPYRADGKPLGSIYEELVVVAQPDELVRGGFLVEPTIFAPGSPNLSRVRVQKGEYVPAEAQAAMEAGTITGDIVEHWRRIVAGGRTVVFACTVEHSIHLRDRFLAAGIPAAHLDGETPGAERDEILRRLRSGALQVVTNCQVLTEGWDLPALEACVLARPTKSTGLYLQMVGRVLRPFAGKQHALVLDHAGATRAHGWPTAAREFSLTEPPRLTDARGRDVTGPLVATCKSCFAAYPRTLSACPQCGHPRAAEQAPPEEQDGELQEISRDEAPAPPPMSEQRREYAKLYYFARNKGFKPTWASYEFKRRFHTWPSREVTAGFEDYRVTAQASAGSE
jgi:superfamily II DNA or RNA helicase